MGTVEMRDRPKMTAGVRRPAFPPPAGGTKSRFRKIEEKLVEVERELIRLRAEAEQDGEEDPASREIQQELRKFKDSLDKYKLLKRIDDPKFGEISRIRLGGRRQGKSALQTFTDQDVINLKEALLPAILPERKKD